jgi:hypothetical protein
MEAAEHMLCIWLCIWGAEMRQDAYFYLLGLLCGKGYIYEENQQLAIEFAHSNEFIEGIAHCQSCGFLATKPPSGDFLVCKNLTCRGKVPKDVKKRYEQSQATKRSTREVIAPFICAETQIRSAISGNKSMTMLILNFKSEVDLFADILKDLRPGSDYTNFRIPESVLGATKENRLEFLNGLLDATGYANAGSWIPRDGSNGTGRMRLYIQIVKNWNLTSDIDAFVRDRIGKPIQTIDWGHPNIRDSNLQDFRESREAAWAREHQIKFFPEYFLDITFRLEHKAQMFKELLEHNLSCGFLDDNGWFPPGKIRDKTRKPRHPGEDDPRLPKEVRRHFDAFWQLNLALGSPSFTPLLKSAVNSETFFYTGDLQDSRQPDTVIQELESIWQDLNAKLPAARHKVSSKKINAMSNAELEKATYGPLVKILSGEMSRDYGPDAIAYDTSSGNLNAFLARLDDVKLHELSEWDSFDIRPDVVGFASSEPRPVFVESKIELLSLKHLGQLLGYCAAANPKRAILVSTQPLSEGLTRAILRDPTLLNYCDDGVVEIGQLVGDRIEYWGLPK